MQADHSLDLEDDSEIVELELADQDDPPLQPPLAILTGRAFSTK